MTRLILLLSLLPTLAFAGSETPLQALKSIPALPASASQDMDCSLGAALHKKAEAATRDSAAFMQSAAANAAPMSMTPEQMTAMQQLTDPAFTMCPIDVMQPEAQGWSQAAEEKLAGRLSEINQAKMKADQAWCEKHSTGEMCDVNLEGARKFNAQAVAAGTQYLKDVQPGYARFQKLTTDCLMLRDKPVAVTRRA
jgi:hypothetical protein